MEKKKKWKYALQTAEIQSKVKFFYVLSLSFIASQKMLRSWKRMSKQGKQQILNHKCFAPCQYWTIFSAFY